MDFIWETAEEIDLALARRFRTVRKRRGISQEELSRETGISVRSIRRFEASGNTSLRSLTKLAMALGCTEEIRELFSQVPYQSIEEVIRESNS